MAGGKSTEASMHHVLARITVQPEAADAARAILIELVRHTRSEAGCLRYELYQQAEHPQVFQTVELWQDRAAAEAHMRTPHVGAAIAAVGPLLAGPPEILACAKLM